MIDIIWGPRFKRAYKKKLKQHPDLKTQLFAALKLFIKDQFHPLLKTHKLEGPLKGNYAFSLGYDLRVVFKFLDKKEVFLKPSARTRKFIESVFLPPRFHPEPGS